MIFCSKCNKENNDDASFCQYCGTKIKRPEKKQNLTEDGQISLNLKTFDINFKLIFSLIVAILIIADTFLLLLMDFSDVSPITAQNIIYFDLMVCFVLFCGFMYRLRAAENKKGFFKDKNNLITIIAMIPINFFAFRLLRYIKILPLIYKGLKHFNKFLTETHINWSFGILIVTIFAGTISFYVLEHGINKHVQSLWDSFLYVMPTIVTAGSSDILPQTPAGEIIGIVLMVTGIICFGLFTASIASVFIKSDEQDDKEDLNELKKSVEGMEREMKQLKKLIKNK